WDNERADREQGLGVACRVLVGALALRRGFRCGVGRSGMGNSLGAGDVGWLSREFPWLRPRLPTLWTNSYFVAVVGGAPLELVKRYIESQKRSEGRGRCAKDVQVPPVPETKAGRDA